MQTVNNNHTAFKSIILGKGGKEVLRELITSDDNVINLNEIVEEQKNNIAADIFISKDEIAVQSKLYPADRYVPTGGIVNYKNVIFGTSTEYELAPGSSKQFRETYRNIDGIKLVKLRNERAVSPVKDDSFITYKEKFPNKFSSLITRIHGDTKSGDKLNAALDIASSMHGDEIENAYKGSKDLQDRILDTIF